MSKSRRGKSASTNEISRWEQELTQAPFNEDTWKACVVFASPNNVDDNIFIDILSDVVATGLRKLFSVITYEGLIKDVREYGKAQTGGGKGKGGASSKPPPFHEVCEQVKPLVDQGDPIPPSLMAKLLKFKLLTIKHKDLERREEEKKAAKLAEAGKKDEKGKKSRSPSGKRSKSPGKGKKGKKGESDMPPSPKKDSKLKKRGDVEDTFKTIDDEPDDEGCPQHYIIIQGVLMAPVIQYLCDVGIAIDAIIRIKAESYDMFKQKKDSEVGPSEQPAVEEPNAEAFDTALREEEAAAKRKESEKELQTFWLESDNIVLKVPSGHRLKDMAKYDVTVKERSIPEENLQELEGEKRIDFGTVIFEDVAVTCYDMYDHFLQYKSYLDSMKLLHVHTIPPSAPSGLQAPSLADVQSSTAVPGLPAGEGAPPVSVKPDQRYYKHLLEAVPPESQSVPIILHCLLEQVTATVDDNNPLDKEVPPRDDGLNHLLASYITGKAGKLALQDNDKQSVVEPFSGEKKHAPSSSPVMLHHGNELMSRAHHLTSINGLDPKTAELNMLNFLPQNDLRDLPPQKAHEIAARAARANELRHFISPDVNPGTLDHALKQYAFEGMLLKVANEDGDIVDPIRLDEAFKSYSNPWDYPYTRLEEFRKVKFCSDESGKLKISSLDATGTPLTSFRNLDNWRYAEHLDQNTLLQVLQEAQFALPYIDTYYHKRDSSLLLALHNPVGPHARSSSSWQTKLHSNVGFRNYLEHVVTSINSWVSEQERARREANRTPTPPPQVQDMPTPPLKVGSRYGLMTRSEMNALKAEEEEKNKKGSRRKSARPGSRSSRNRSAKPRDKSGDHSPEKKDKKREGSASSRPMSSVKGSLSVKSASSKEKRGRTRSRMSAHEEPEPEAQSVEVPLEEHYDFVGYDVGDNLIHASGSQSTLFPCDGGQIRVDKTSFVQGAKNVRVSVYKDGNVFVLHFLEPVDEILTMEEVEGEKESDTKPEDSVQEDGEVKDEGIEKSETEGTEKDTKEEPTPAKPKGPKPFSDFSSFVAQFSDGMTLAHSGYGASGTLKNKDPESEVLHVSGPIIPDPAPAHGTPSPQPKVGSPKGRKKADEETKRMEELQQQQEEERARLEEEARKRAEEEKLRKPFQSLYITCPDGLHLEFFNDGTYESDGDRGGVGVRQSYPVRGGGKQECEEARLKPAMEEQSRTILTNGTVIKLMSDGGVQVLYPDGAHSRCPLLPVKPKEPLSKPGSASGPKPPEPTHGRKSMRPSASQKSVDENPVPAISLPEKIQEWTGTRSDGHKIVTRPDGEVVEVEGVLSSMATCSDTGQVLRCREDNVVIVERPDGTVIVEHSDGTRITTFYQQHRTQTPDNETGSEAQYGTASGKFVKVECPGFATLIFESESGACETVFGNGATMCTKADGEMNMARLDGSQLHLDTKGVMSFVPRELAAQVDVSSREPADDSANIPVGVYVMRTNRQVCCELQDANGAHFSVVSNGQMAVERADSGNSESNQPNAEPVTSEETKPASLENVVTVAPLTSLVPRYFIIHADGTGSELLRESDVKEFLTQAESDPATAVLRAPVEGHPGVTGITILRPHTGGISRTWLRQKDEKTIIPCALRERDFRSLPSQEDKTPGPKFGTNVGAGVNVGAVTKPEAPALITCPRALEFRQLIEYSPLTLYDRQCIVKAIENYSEYVEKREQGLDSILPQDPRDESEKLAAEQLETKIEEIKKREQEGLKEGEVATTADRPRPPSNDTTDVKDNIRDTADQLADQIEGSAVCGKYVDAITPAPVPTPPPPKWKRSDAEWERDRIELAELEYGKHALRYEEVPNYFETVEGQAFLRKTYSNDMPDMESLTAALAEQTRHPPPGEASVPDTPVSDNATTDGTNEASQQNKSPDMQQSGATNGEGASPSVAVGGTLSPNNLRPTNPTPAHAKDGGTPTILRPTNPTPGHAASKQTNPRPSNPTPKHAMGEVAGNNATDSPSPGESPQWRNNLESVQEVEVPVPEQNDGMGLIVTHMAADLEEEEIMNTPDDPNFGPRSLYIDVTGEMRREKVPLPKSILGSKPGALPNSQFMEIEDPVRRRVQTVSVAGGNKLTNGAMDNMRGFELLPPQVSFGVLKEGCTYINTVLLKNIGIDSCRYKVKQPPPSTGLRVLYNPGPVAAGMSAKLDIEIFAVAVGVSGESGVGQVGHHVEIVTETDALYLPVTATILTSYEYENRYGDMDSGLSKGSRRVPNRPPSRDPTRPRKAEDYALISGEA